MGTLQSFQSSSFTSHSRFASLSLVPCRFLPLFTSWTYYDLIEPTLRPYTQATSRDDRDVIRTPSRVSLSQWEQDGPKWRAVRSCTSSTPAKLQQQSPLHTSTTVNGLNVRSRRRQSRNTSI